MDIGLSTQSYDAALSAAYAHHATKGGSTRVAVDVITNVGVAGLSLVSSLYSA